MKLIAEYSNMHTYITMQLDRTKMNYTCLYDDVPT